MVPVHRMRRNFLLLVVQDLSNMLYLYPGAFALQDTLQVHKAAHIRSCDILRSVPFVIGYPVFAHLDRYGLFAHAESTSKATAFIHAVQGYQLQPLYLTEQGFGLGESGSIELRHLRQAQTPLPVAALVQAYPVGEVRLQIRNLYYIRQELHQLIHLGAYARGRLLVLVGMQVILDMQRTTTRRAYDVVKLTKVTDEKIVAVVGKMLKARVGHGLAAAGMLQRKLDRTPYPFEYFQRGYGHSGVELVHVTGNK